LTDQGRSATRLVGFWHAVGQLATMLSLGAGPVSFTHIVKALEPFFSAIVSGILLQNWMPAPVYATLVPVVGGVGYACLKERSFSWLAFGMAMVSNLAFALRAVLSKVAMSSKTANLGTNLTSPNVFGLVTIAAFFLSIPMALVGEGRSIQATWSRAMEENSGSAADLIKAIVYSGLFHYLNNEVMYLALGKVHPITLAVGNTMKRVFIMVASVLVFQNEITPQAGIGSAIGIAGVLLYSVTKQLYEQPSEESNVKKDNEKRRT
jgi:solute carrier family 35 protein E1